MVVEFIINLILLQDHKLVVELEDANILVVIVVVERVKQALVDVNVHANALVDASVLPALAALVKDSARSEEHTSELQSRI